VVPGDTEFVSKAAVVMNSPETNLRLTDHPEAGQTSRYKRVFRCQCED